MAAPGQLAVLGAGVMGKGIATLAIGRGIPVSLVDVDETALSAARTGIAAELRLARLLGGVPRVGPVGELVTTTSVEAVGSADVVVEAISEDVDSKVAAHVAVCAVVRPGTLRVTNTSSIPIAEMAAAVPDPEHLVGVHFMNPPYAIRTVEVVRGPATGDAAMAALHDLLAALDRTPVVVADGPGFVTSRILHRMINDAVRVVEEGRATAEAVDTLMESAIGHRTGPLRTADLIGLDNLADSLRVLYERTGDESFRPSELLQRLVSEGALGRKSGRGFYDYPS